jgi:mono/diheme cytochrome c family protein
VRLLLPLLAAVAWAGAGAAVAASAAAPPAVDFRRDVLPILADHCFACHGPDAHARKANLRLDQAAGALRQQDPVIVPGRSAESEVIIRVTSDDPDERMPPPRKGRTLSPAQVDCLKRWIDEGALWGRHWAFEPPRAQVPPFPPGRTWPRNPIDAFVLARLDSQGLKPSPEAPRTTLIRRVTLDLTGLPPTPSEVDAFLQDGSADAYERVVDRLLQSPRFGERMASRWLDAARYADTNGYQNDGERVMWRWRDWVIAAYNRNLPFDQFTIEQLAGDLLPNPTLDQLIATGFNRNHRGNAEGGIIPEEYAVEYVVDRVETTATVWLGLTIGCARCHDHKFDPITQREFYQLFAFFNNVPERGKAIKFGNSPPYIKTPTPYQAEQLQALDTRLSAAEQRFRALEPVIAVAQADWEPTLTGVPAKDWTPTQGSLAEWLSGKAGFTNARWALPTLRGLEPDTSNGMSLGDIGDFGFLDKFSCGAWVRAEAGQGGIILSRMMEGARSEGYSLTLREGVAGVNLVKRWLDDALRVETAEAIEPGAWHHVMFTYDGSRVAGGIKIYVDGTPKRLKVQLDDLNQSFQTRAPFRIGSGGGTDERFEGQIDDVRVYGRALDEDEVTLVAETGTLSAIAAIPAGQRTERQARKLRAAFLEQAAPPAIRSAWQEILALRSERQAFFESIPTTMIMRELDPPRPAHVLIRGVYDKPGERVAAGVPSALPPLPMGEGQGQDQGQRPDRRALARWLVDPANPLTARVAVNRLWQMVFGVGFVKTAEDFGVQGERPSHPELLDWLALEFVRSGWDVKGLLRTIVTSATYRQSSQGSPELHRRDPENRLLARGPRFRLSAEMIRDQALAVSGLLVERIGGPSVRPYQPAGLWKELTGAEDYRPDTGPGLYRRSLYTFWKRTVAPPSMVTFDAAGRETCSVREVRTNTPLQALTLLNDVTYVEAARVLAERVLFEGGPHAEARVEYAMRLVTGRPPVPRERTVLAEGLRAYQARYDHDPDTARQLINNGAASPSAAIDPRELAAYTALANLILNLDETVTKE